MGKKYEFRPDKPRSGFLSKLYLTQKQRRSLLKWCLYGAVLLVLSILQDVVFCRMRILGASTELVPCGIFLICMLEGIHTGSVFALVASLVYLFSGTAPGAYAMVLLVVLAVVICVFRQAYLQKDFSSVMLCTGVGLLAYELTVFVMGLFLGLTTPDRVVGFCITALLSGVAAPILYPIAVSIRSLGGEVWKE
ncbi:MAG: hypothetical protein IKK41_00545 [Oscillospiraceae bacterium]|nr:hypothetical protein [Oscillospiraceae bacterium]